MRISVTQRGDPYENALAERVNGILKTEWINWEEFESFSHAQTRIEEIISLYNTRRLHRSHQFETPQQVHQRGKRKAKKVLKKSSANAFRTMFVNS